MPDEPEIEAKVSVPGTASGIVETPIRTQRVVRADGVRRHLSVFCERRASSVALDQCTSCDRFAACAGDAAATPGTLTCQMHDGAAPPEHPTTLLVGAAMSVHVVCAGPEVMLVEVRPVLSAGIDVVPVVSEAGHLLGLLRMNQARVAATRTVTPVGELMSGAPTTVGEATPLARALREMALARARQVVVVCHDNRVIGVLRDVDAMMRLARAERP